MLALAVHTRCSVDWSIRDSHSVTFGGGACLSSVSETEPLSHTRTEQGTAQNHSESRLEGALGRSKLLISLGTLGRSAVTYQVLGLPIELGTRQQADCR